MVKNSWSLTLVEQRKTLDIITLFHKPNNPASTRVATLLKQASANAQAEATIDQASDHSNQTSPARDDFELNITEDAPTQDQVQTILEYVGKNKIQSVIKGARDQKDALQKFKENKDSFQRPIVSRPLVPRLFLRLGDKSKDTCPDTIKLTAFRLWTGTMEKPLWVITNQKF